MTDDELGVAIIDTALKESGREQLIGLPFDAGRLGAAARRLVIAELLAGAGVDRAEAIHAMTQAFNDRRWVRRPSDVPKDEAQKLRDRGLVPSYERWVWDDCMGAAYDALAPILARLVAERDAAREVADSAKWNAMMRPTPAPPADGTVRVRIPVHVGNGGDLIVNWIRFSAGHEHDGDINRYVAAWITADIPLPQPVEIPGAVEAPDAK